MRRFWILFLTELKVWRHDPIPIMGGFIAPTVMLVAFGLLFGGRLSFPIAVLNYDAGPYGAILRESFDEVMSPFGAPYFEVIEMSEEDAWAAFQANRIDAVWVIPEDFSARLDAGEHPTIEMHFSNYNDDRAKNHRIYSAEIMWHFYEEIGQPAPPLAIAEEYPRPEMVSWLSIIGVGLVLLSVTLGAMFNIFMLTYKEQIERVTVEFGLSPRSLALILLPKITLAFVMGLVTGLGLLFIFYLWTGIWPGRYLWAVLLLCGLVSLFWIALALIMGLRVRNYMAGAIAAVLTGVTAFFIGGGLAPIRYYSRGLVWFAWIFPNTYAVDPLRELILFDAWPANWLSTTFILLAFAIGSLGVSFALTNRYLRRLG
jgi:ABC-2 type transport system permease protein